MALLESAWATLGGRARLRPRRWLLMPLSGKDGAVTRLNLVCVVKFSDGSTLYRGCYLYLMSLLLVNKCFSYCCQLDV